jgi:holliday junction DNA helicase RuvA
VCESGAQTPGIGLWLLTMIGRLHGNVVSESIDGLLVIDVGGVGYEVLVPLGTLGRAGHSGGAVTLQVVTHVREDAITLFGFANEHERATFRLLTSVAGIGPKIAIGVLGALPPHELAVAITRNDVKRLQGVPGVGRRLAERLALELKDKIGATVGPSGTGVVASTGYTVSSSPTVAAGPTAQLVATLVNLGFKQPEVERVAAEFAPRAGEPIDVLVRDALKRLVK